MLPGTHRDAESRRRGYIKSIDRYPAEHMGDRDSAEPMEDWSDCEAVKER